MSARHQLGLVAGRKLIVNADDFGRATGINRGILEAHQRGIVTSATLMVNYAAAHEAAEMARGAAGLGVGLHVALTGGLPALSAERVPTLVDERGVLPRTPDGLAAARTDEALAEARAQLERFRLLLGRDPTHFDSHHHSHRLPAVLEALVTLGRETGRPVRNAGGITGERLRHVGVRTTDAFVESFFGDGATLEALLAIVMGLGPGTSELMCHPGYSDDDLRAGSSYADVRERELRVLTDPRVRGAVDAAGVELIHFGQL